MRMLTNASQAPAGFTFTSLSKADLLAAPVALWITHLDELALPLEDCVDRLLGIVFTPGESMQLVRLSRLSWWMTVPAHCMDMVARLAPGWLDAIEVADAAYQRASATEFKIERMARELDMTRLDYNELTSRLRQQVCDLLDAKMELTALNETLESKVAQRTAELEAANASLVKALDDLQRTQAELVRTAQLAGLGTLVAGVAHELNTPIGNGLTIVTTLAHETRVMKSGYEEGRLKRSMLDTYIRNVEDIYEVLERNLVRAGDIVSHFKQLSVDQASDVRRRFVLSDVVRDTMTAISPRIRKTPYRVVLELESGIEMDSYPGTISQILANFITNALAHAFDGRTGGSMTIRSATMEEDMVELSFIDDGNGIPEEVLQHVFEPFFTTRFGQGGSGLGLYVVYNQVHKLLGGRIDVASEPGCGTTFRLLLPIIACRSAEIHSLPLCGTR
ncbi:MAG TPA: ATP-binding protein [Noviherbaspirillum sp.]